MVGVKERKSSLSTEWGNRGSVQDKWKKENC